MTKKIIISRTRAIEADNVFLGANNLFNENLGKILKIWLFFGFLCILVFLCAYVVQVNKSTTDRYQIQKYEKQLNILSKESQSLEAQLALSNAGKNMDTLMTELNFEKQGQVSYVKYLGNEVVINK